MEAPCFDGLAEVVPLAQLELGRPEMTAQQMDVIARMALILLTECWVHRDHKRALYDVDPLPALQRLIGRIYGRMPEQEFHERMTEIFDSLRDLHTAYVLPQPYRRRIAFLPFMVEEYYGEDFNPAFVVSKLHASAEAAGLRRGATVTHWNGIPIERAVRLNAARRAGSNVAAQRARGIDGLTFRWLGGSVRPEEDWVTLTTRDSEGVRHTAFPWWVALRGEAGPTGDRAASRSLALGLDEETEWIRQLKAALFAAEVADADPFFPGVLRSCRLPPPHADIGYLRIFTFSVDKQEGLVLAVARILAGMPKGGLVIDVRGNGGGSIVAAERMLQLFSPCPIEPQPLRFRNSELTLRILANGDDVAAGSSKLYEAMETLSATGAAFSPPTWFAKPAAYNDLERRYHGRVVLLVDPLSYSATDVFAAGVQDHELGGLLGTSGMTGGGGANVWGYESLRELLQDGLEPQLEPLPLEASFTIAMRALSRVGPMAGLPLEDVGVDSMTHRVTRRDVLEGNRDLIAAAVELLTPDQQVADVGWDSHFDEDLLARAVAGEIGAAMRILEIASRSRKRGVVHEALWYTHPGAAHALAQRDPAAAARLAARIADHLADCEDLTLSDTRAAFATLLKAAAGCEDEPRALKAATGTLFAVAVAHRRLHERDGTRRWLSELTGDAAETVAAALRRQRGARAWYTAEGWRPPATAHPAIRAVLKR